MRARAGDMRLDWDALGTAGADAADGAEIELAGFIRAAARPGWYLLSPEPGCCVGCLPRDEAGCVEVFARDSVPSVGTRIRLRGRWRVRSIDATGWRYQLHDARPAEPPGWTSVSRRSVLVAGPLMCLAAFAPGTEPADAQEPSAWTTLRRLTTIDIHSHASAINGVARVTGNAPPLPVAAPMNAGGLAVVCLAAVSDSPVHRVMPDDRIHPFRDPRPGELYAWSQLAFARVHRLVTEQKMPVITDAASLRAALADRPSAVIAAEGADFLEGDPDRVDEAYERWQLRHLQLTHYRVNELGDIQTEPPVHDGLTDAGAEVIRRCNRRGLVVDVAHGTYELVVRAASVTTKPLVLSHTSLTARPKPRSPADLTRPCARRGRHWRRDRHLAADHTVPDAGGDGGRHRPNGRCRRH